MDLIPSRRHLRQRNQIHARGGPCSSRRVANGNIDGKEGRGGKERGPLACYRAFSLLLTSPASDYILYSISLANMFFSEDLLTKKKGT